MIFKRLFSPTLKARFESDYIPQRIPDASPLTLKAYNITFNFFDDFLGRPARLSDLNNKTVASFQRHRLTQVGKATVKRDIDNLKAVWNYFCREGKIAKFPNLKPLCVATPTPVALTEEQIHLVWQSIQAETRPVVIKCTPLVEVAAPIWWSPIFLACWDTGERFSPVFEIKERDVDLDNLWLRFPAGDRKGQREDNIKPISQDTAEAVEKLLSLYSRRHYNTRVFRWALNKGIVWSRMGDIMRRAGLPDTREFKFHCIRKSTASHIRAAGGDAQQLLGHSDGRTTEKHYIDPRIAHDDRSNLARLFRPGQTA